MAFLVALLTFAGSAMPAFSETRYVSSDTSALSRLNLHLNGLTYHFSTDRDELNELNYGLGFAYELGRFTSDTGILDQAIVTFEGEVYSDSFSQLGGAIGAALQKNVWRFLDVGLRAGLIHEQNLQEKVGSPVFPYLLPYMETRFGGPVDVRITLVPAFGKTTGGFVAGQVVLRLWK